MINDTARLMNDMNVVTSIISPDVNEVKLMHRLEEILSNYDIKRKTELDLEDDLSEKMEMFFSAKRLEGLSQTTIEGYLIELKLFHNYIKKPTVMIKTHDIRGYLSSEKTWKTGTIDKKLSVIKSFFGWLVEEELLLHDPSRKVKPPKQSRRIPKSLTVEELETVRENCETLRERALIEVLYSTACRLSEMANLRLSDIDFQNMSAKVIGKGDKERTVFFSFKAMHHLNKYLLARKEPLTGRSNYLFISERRPFTQMSNGGIQFIVRKIRERANLSKNLTPHTFRHTFATLSMENGADLADVQHLLGHERPETTLVYAHISEDRKKQAHKRFHMQ